jgi:hypothetical protein
MVIKGDYSFPPYTPLVDINTPYASPVSYVEAVENVVCTALPPAPAFVRSTFAVALAQIVENGVVLVIVPRIFQPASNAF